MEKMLIFSYLDKNRRIAVSEVKKIVDFHQRKTGGSKRVLDDKNYDNSESKSKSRSKSEGSRRSFSRSRSRNKNKNFFLCCFLFF